MSQSQPVISRDRLQCIFQYLDQAAAAAGSNHQVTLPLSTAAWLLRDIAMVDVAVLPVPANDNDANPLEAA